MKKPTKLKVLGIVAALALTAVLAGCGTTASAAGSDNGGAGGDLNKRVGDLENLMKVQQTSINPGLGTVMIEYGQRMNKLWYAAQAQNWDLAQYQIREMKEIQETGEIDKPARADALKDFESKNLDPLEKAAAAKDLAQFTSTYKTAIANCNKCHTDQKDPSNNVSSFKFIKVQIPTSEPTGGLEDYKGAE